ncbi:MAG TPA: tetratricopeptide repeat protein [Ignavibacteria bacterium]|jgi:tetratricopeptide (TPR) repeat protein
MYNLLIFSTKLFLFLLFSAFISDKIFSQSADEIFASVNDAIVVVEAYDFDGAKSMQGSGVIIKDKNILVTNFHIFAGSEKLKLMHKDKEIKFTEIIGFSVDRDVLVLKLEDGDYPQIKIGTTTDLKVGGKVYAIGSPMGLENTMTEGIVGGFRKFDDKKNNIEYVQISAALSPGSSGGAVLNSSGELIGISTMGMKEGENLNFAIKIEDVLNVDLGEYSDKVKLEAINYFFKGKSLYDNGDYNKAVEYYDKYIQKVPLDAKAFNFRGLAYLQMKEYDKASKDFDKSSKIDPNYFAPLLNKGDLDYKMGEYEKAVKDFTKIIAKKPDLTSAYYARGLAKMKMEDWSDAVDDFNKVIKLDPDYTEAYINKGISYYYNRQFMDAIICWKKAISIDPSLTNALNDWIDQADAQAMEK